MMDFDVTKISDVNLLNKLEELKDLLACRYSSMSSRRDANILKVKVRNEILHRLDKAEMISHLDKVIHHHDDSEYCERILAEVTKGPPKGPQPRTSSGFSYINPSAEGIGPVCGKVGCFELSVNECLGSLRYEACAHHLPEIRAIVDRENSAGRCVPVHLQVPKVGPDHDSGLRDSHIRT